MNKISAKISQKNVLSIVSCSFLVEVKQVDKIIRSLKLIATKMSEISFTWTHIGDGVLYDNLILLAKSELSGLENIQYDFVGNYENEQVYEFYKNNPVDLFINVSSSEGVPVSIMEAMSCHIPIVAPDVGGVNDMVVDGYNGILLKSHFTVSDIVLAIKKIEFFKSSKTRDGAYKIFLERYDAKKNYVEFIKDYLIIAGNSTKIINRRMTK